VRSLVDWIVRRFQRIEERLSGGATVLGIRRSVQLTTWGCGAHSAFMVLEYFHKARSITAVSKALGTDESGTSTMAILRLFRRRGLKPRINARATLQHLATALDQGAPCVVSMDNGEHFAVAFGHDRDQSVILLADPSIRRSLRVRVQTETFCARWDRWLMAVHRR